MYFVYASKVMSFTGIPMSSDIFLDRLIIGIHFLQLIASAIVMLAF